jgi:RNA polymerase sigma-70 factor (ECF subfamily)
MKVVDRVSEIPVGTDRSFAGVIGPHVQSGYRLACAMLHDAAAAEDAVQEASFIAWKKLPRLHDQGRLRAWFLGIVANECRNARRRGWFARVRTGLPEVVTAASAEEPAVRRADLRRALLRLGHDERLIVVLYFYLDLPLEDVATVAGISVTAARSRLYRAVRRLRPHVDIQEAVQ